MTNLSKDLANIMKKSKGEADLKEHKKQSVREMEDRIIGMGKKARNEVRQIGVICWLSHESCECKCCH